MKVVIIHYHEIGLKGGNRSFFEKTLQSNIKRALKDIDEVSVKRISGRFLLYYKDQQELIEERLKTVFGIAYFSFGQEVKPDLAVLKKEMVKQLKPQSFKNFRISAKRADKNFPIKSMEMEKEVGAAVVKAMDKKVKLVKPEMTGFIEVVDKTALVYTGKISGPGGLPVGVSGNIVSLISAGFDSPVASYRMMRRGAKMVYVHFHSHPYTKMESIENVQDIVTILNKHQLSSTLYLVAFGDIQKNIVANSPEKMRVVLYRRMMVRIAEQIAAKHKALALVTGESLGQVASQTAENIFAVADATNLPIYRPLIGDDKEDIIKESQKIGTHDISSQPYEDCCSLFAPHHPITKAKMDEVDEVERNLDIEKLVEQGMKNIETKKFTFIK